ncbi:RING-H2 finger protein ATL16 [Cucumis sativus]|uniref:RING-type domain-containing protein n=1 Tax=Cucumis sativus TaxID=3659 RepID=A0A0A0LRB0_CUCSA|nr:RING-H2 finger protein ATL16 [Cucumis sativus]KGN63362.1 hypothetical protein Csa_022479 [Cucumis sativus]
MSSPTTFSFRCSIRCNANGSAATNGQPLQFVELRLGHFSQLVLSPSHQILQQTSPILISDTLIRFPLRELEDPPFISHSSLCRFLSSYNISDAVCDAIFLKISSFAFQLVAGNLNSNFHIIAALDFVYTHWVDLDPAEDAAAVRQGAPRSAIERLMKEKYDGNGGEEMEDECSVCYEDLHGKTEKEKEVSRIPCGHMFHKSCILKWLKISNSCPLCRGELEA